MTNPLPDFGADDPSRDLLEKTPTEPSGFKKLFGSKAAAYGRSSKAIDLEKDVPLHAADEDFEYRGVTNSNNLDPVFRSAGSSVPVSGAGSSQTSTKHHSRYNSEVTPLFTMHEHSQDAAGQPEEHNVSSDLEAVSDDEFLFRNEPHAVWTGDNSNNSRLRFAEEF